MVVKKVGHIDFSVGLNENLYFLKFYFIKMEFLREKYLLLLRDAISDALFEIPVEDNKKVYPETIALGKIWPSKAVSMLGLARLNNIKALLDKVLIDNIPGDFLEAGVWRGGACIYAKGILDSWGDNIRQVIVADSFEGLPPPDPKKYPVDNGDLHHTIECLAVSEGEVRNNFVRFGLLDDRVKFIKGFFNESFKKPLPFENLSVLRLDGDMYSSTIETLEALYDKVSVGGYIIIDDYVQRQSVSAAVTDFRQVRGISDHINVVDWSAVWWQKSNRDKDLPEDFSWEKYLTLNPDLVKVFGNNKNAVIRHWIDYGRKEGRAY